MCKFRAISDPFRCLKGNAEWNGDRPCRSNVTLLHCDETKIGKAVSLPKLYVMKTYGGVDV
jgi:hypothetical protein